MRKTALVAFAVLAALALAGSALAAYSSARLVVATQGKGLRIGVSVANGDDPTARAAIYVPNGYTLGSPTGGAKLGTVTATAAAADLGGAVLPLTGELDAVDPGTLTAAQKTGVSQCLAGQAAAQTWMLRLSAVGQMLEVPMLVVPATPAEAAAGYQAKLVVCLPPPDLPSGAPGRAPFGAKVLSTTFGVSAIAPPTAPGESRWTATFTPYRPGAGIASPAGTVETQSIHRVPARLTLTYTKKRVVVRGRVMTKVTFASAATEAGKPAGGPITTSAGGKKVGGARGSFTFAGASVTLTATADLHRGTAVPTGAAPSSADLWYTDLGAGACIKTAIFGGPACVAATVGRATPRSSVRIAGFRR
jgi:hypothetical protein